jgi:two-component system, OmpR family, sensor kinase
MTTPMTTTDPPPPPRARRLAVPVRGARFRIIAAVVGLLALSTVASILIAREILHARVDERVEDELVQEVREFRLLVADGRNPETGRPFGDDVRSMFDVFLARNVPAADEEFFTFLDGRPYRTTARTRVDAELIGRIGPAARATDVVRRTFPTPRGDVRALAVPVVVDGRRAGVFAVTAGLGAERDEVDEAMQVAAGVSLAVLLVSSLLAWAAAGRVLAPLRDLTETARSITETDLTRRISVQGDDEIARLATTFNAMLDRLEAAFGSQRAFISDAGHELRTPITIIRGHLELLGDDPDERRETTALVTDELDRMSRFVDDLLTLAKAERADFLKPEDLDLDVLTEELVAKARGLAARDWQVEHIAAGRVRADRQRLTQAMVNLASNAVQHTHEGDRIALGSALAGDRARLWVADTGPGVAEADRERIFERFARADTGRRRSDGAGLGLAIVRAIAEAHGGEVRLENGAPGARFTIEIPIAPPEELPR